MSGCRRLTNDVLESFEFTNDERPMRPCCQATTSARQRPTNTWTSSGALTTRIRDVQMIPIPLRLKLPSFLNRVPERRRLPLERPIRLGLHLRDVRLRRHISRHGVIAPMRVRVVRILSVRRTRAKPRKVLDEKQCGRVRNEPRSQRLYSACEAAERSGRVYWE